MRRLDPVGDSVGPVDQFGALMLDIEHPQKEPKFDLQNWMMGDQYSTDQYCHIAMMKLLVWKLEATIVPF